MLSVLSSFIPEIAPLTIDGIFGPATENSVRAAQRRFNIPETGIVDRETWDEIYYQFSGIENAGFRNTEQFPYAQESGSQNMQRARYARTTTMTQYPGAPLSSGAQDPVKQEVVR